MATNLENILGPIEKIEAGISDPFGGTPCIVLTTIYLKDGTVLWVEGEHDTAYIPLDANKMDREKIISAVDRGDHDEEDFADLMEAIEIEFQ